LQLAAKHYCLFSVNKSTTPADENGTREQNEVEKHWPSLGNTAAGVRRYVASFFSVRRAGVPRVIMRIIFVVSSDVARRSRLSLPEIRVYAHSAADPDEKHDDPVRRAYPRTAGSPPNLT